MPQPGFDRPTLGAIALGGVLGASLRWAINRLGASPPSTAGWFTYAPNTSVTVGTNVSGFEPAPWSEPIRTPADIPFDTLFVNVLGCLALGALTLLLLRSVGRKRRLLVGAATGFCGSLTTFSAFAVEVALFLRGRPLLASEGDGLQLVTTRSVPAASTYVLLSLAGGAFAFWLGRRLATRSITPPEAIARGGER